MDLRGAARALPAHRMPATSGTRGIRKLLALDDEDAFYLNMMITFRLSGRISVSTLENNRVIHVCVISLENRNT